MVDPCYRRPGTEPFRALALHAALSGQRGSFISVAILFF
jgi:hypothetical protein